ncbi:MAG: MFS transporter [Chloroflexi bacterium]|nr:MAG: MFS transporter [Chloroflexota bacterium]
MTSEVPSAPPPEEPPLRPGLRGTLSAFEVPNFRWLFASRVSSNIARQMRVFLRAWMVLELTDSPLLMGLVVSSLSWPMLVLPFVGGVMADRMDRKRILQWTESLLTVLWFMTALSIVFGAMQIGPEFLRVKWWHFIITSFLSGVIQSIGRPGHQSMIGSIMTGNRLPSAVALDSISDTWPRIAGPSIAAGAIWMVGGPWQHWGPWLFMLTASLQGITALSIFMMTWQPGMNVAKMRASMSAWGDFIEGMTVIRGNSLLLSLVGLGFSITLFAGGANFLLPVFARDVLGGDAATFGLLATAQTIGSSLGSAGNVLLLNLSNRGRLLLIVGLLNAVGIIAFSQSTILILSAVLIAFASMANMFFSTSQRMLLQRFAPNEARGRIMAMDAFQQGLHPIGVLVWGSIALQLQRHYGTAHGTQVTWMFAGILYATVIIGFFTFVPRLRDFGIGEMRTSTSPGPTKT